MAMDAETIRFVRQEVQRQLNVILSGESGDNSDIENETIDNLYPGTPSIASRPVMHPYGLASRAPAGTIQVTAKQGADPSNRMVLGHRDSNRSGLDLDEGEVVLYGADGEVVLTTMKVSPTKGWRVETKFGFIEWDFISNLNFDTGTVQGQIGHGGKVNFTNALGELFDTIHTLFTTATAGGFPLILDPVAELALLSFVEGV